MLQRLYVKMPVMFLAIGITVNGCAVGPNFKEPKAPDTNTYTSAPLRQKIPAVPETRTPGQRIVFGQDIPFQWWTLFHSQEINQVMQRALANNPTLASAEAAIRQAQELFYATVGSSLLPRVDANASVTRSKSSGTELGQSNTHPAPFTLYNATVNVTYTLDIAGGARRELESLRAQVDYQRFQREAVYLTLTSNIVTTAIREASLRGQLQAMREIVAFQERQLTMIERQYEFGALAFAEVLAQRTQLAQTKTNLPPLEKELAQTRHLLAVLAGILPNEAGALPEFTLANLTLPGDLPVSLPSSLVRQRPDIRASEELLHAACAKIGVATANLYPQVTLSGGGGYSALQPSQLFHPGASAWNLGAGLLQPLFRGGELAAKRRASVAAYDQAEAQYRLVVLQAFQNVADVLRALELDALALKAQADAETAAKNALDLTRKQFELGAVSYLLLLNAERQYQQAKIGLVVAQTARFADTAALFQALGGGWWNRDAKTDTQSLSAKENQAHVLETSKP